MVVEYDCHAVELSGQLIVVDLCNKGEAKGLFNHGWDEDIVCYSPEADFVVFIRPEQQIELHDVPPPEVAEFFDAVALVFANKPKSDVPLHYFATSYRNIKEVRKVAKESESFPVPTPIDVNLVKKYPVGPRAGEEKEEFVERLNEFNGKRMEMRTNFGDAKRLHQRLIRERELLLAKRQETSAKINAIVRDRQNDYFAGSIFTALSTMATESRDGFDYTNKQLAGVRTELFKVDGRLAQCQYQHDSLSNQFSQHFSDSSKKFERLINNILVHTEGEGKPHLVVIEGDSRKFGEEEIDLMALDPQPMTLVEVTTRVHSTEKVKKMMPKCKAFEDQYQIKVPNLILLALSVDTDIKQELDAEIKKIQEEGKHFTLITGNELTDESKLALAAFEKTVKPRNHSIDI